MRILAGTLAGRTLTAPADRRVRPTAEAVRGALLDALADDLPGSRVLDLFAGTGALGLEALSRGAARADFVELRPASLHPLRANIAAFRLRPRTRVFKRDAVAFAAGLAPDSYDLAFADPPYEFHILDHLVGLWRERRFAPVFAVEHARAVTPPPGGHRRLFQDAAVTVYRR